MTVERRHMGRSAPLWECVDERSRRSPASPMIIEADGRTYSFGEAVELGCAWTARLSAQGSGRRRVATYLPVQAAQYMLRLACGKSGFDFTAINPLLTGDTLVDAISRTEVTDIVASPDTAMRIAEVEEKLPPSCSLHVLGDDCEIRTWSTATLPRTVPYARGQDGPAVIIYTSGTSGPAKPFFLSFQRLRRYGQNLIGDNEHRWRPGAGYYGPWHPAHSLGTIGLEAAVDRGLVLVVRKKFAPGEFWPDIVAHDCQITVLMVTGQEIWDARKDEYRENPLEVVGMGPSINASRDFERYFSVDVIGLYGMTEFGTVLTAKSPANGRAAGRPVGVYDCRLGPVPNGYAFPHGAGELLISEKSTGATPGTDEERYPTGDIFTSEEGEYTFVGRIKDTIRHRGRNISAFDLEQIACQIEQVGACVCVGVPAGETETVYTADEDIRIFVEPCTGDGIDPRVLLDELKARLPQFMVPRYIDVVDGLPRTPTGKLARGGLRDRPLGPSTYDRKTGEGPHSLRATRRRDEAHSCYVDR